LLVARPLQGFLTTLGATTSPCGAFGIIAIALPITAFYSSVSGIVNADMFPREIRELGVGLP
jgi:MHS family alpha-ketoglutarate permease-like MFS transporter